MGIHYKKPLSDLMQLSSVFSHSLPFVCTVLKKKPYLFFFLFKNTELVV